MEGGRPLGYSPPPGENVERNVAEGEEFFIFPGNRGKCGTVGARRAFRSAFCPETGGNVERNVAEGEEFYIFPGLGGHHGVGAPVASGCQASRPRCSGGHLGWNRGGDSLEAPPPRCSGGHLGWSRGGGSLEAPPPRRSGGHFRWNRGDGSSEGGIVLQKGDRSPEGGIVLQKGRQRGAPWGGRELSGHRSRWSGPLSGALDGAPGQNVGRKISEDEEVLILPGIGTLASGGPELWPICGRRPTRRGGPELWPICGRRPTRRGTRRPLKKGRDHRDGVLRCQGRRSVESDAPVHR